MNTSFSCFIRVIIDVDFKQIPVSILKTTRSIPIPHIKKKFKKNQRHLCGLNVQSKCSKVVNGSLEPKNGTG